MGWLRNLFGGTVDSEYREDGKRVKKSVSKGQFDSLMRKAVAEDKATLHGACVVHILDPMHDGSRTESWIIGEQVSRETYDRLKHSNGELYVIVYYERGQTTIQMLKKESWDLAANKMPATSCEGEQATKIGKST